MDINLIASNNGEVPETFGNSDAHDTTSAGQADRPELVSEVNRKYAKWRSERRPYEAQWFLNAAMVRGLQASRWNPATNALEGAKVPSHRSRDQINLILSKVRAKLSKFLKSRAVPIVSPASSDHEDILNAKATTKVLEYQWKRLQLEEKYEEVLLHAMVTGKAFWWFFWDENAVAQVREDSMLGKARIHDVPLGDVGVEVGQAFEVLIADPSVMRLQAQPEIMRVKVRPVKDVEQMFQLPPGSIEGELRETELFQYQRQIAQLGSRAMVGFGMTAPGAGEEKPSHIVVKELFTRPCAGYPQGRYVVTAGDKVLHSMDELPYGLAPSNSPFPVVEFSDMLSAGQFWPTTMVEQLIPGQKQYSRLRNKVDEQLKLSAHPWMFIPKQAQVHPDAFGTEAGQKIPFNFQPGMPAPQQWIVRPEPIVQDAYRVMDIIRHELDTISNLYPAAIGQSGSTSGFETNLLQEAADSVHAPDIRRNELALADAAYKVRRLVKLGYDIPRLISIVGRDKSPEVFEFSAEQIDEHADIIIDSGSALPDQKHARIEAILKLDERAAFGPPGDPGRNRKLLRMLNMGSVTEEVDLIGSDEDHARLENLSFTKGEPVEDPMPWEDHDVEYEIHTQLLKSPEIKSWPPEQRAALVRHVILHVKWKNPINAMQLAAMFGMQDVLQEIQQTMMIQQQFMPPAPPQGAGAPPPDGAPQQAPPPPPPQAEGV